MQEFNKENLKKVRKDLDTVLEVATEQLEISLSLGNINYQSGQFHVKLTGVASNEKGEMVPVFVKNFEDFKARTSNKEFLLNIGDSFVFNNESFTISGWKPRSRKYPLLAVGKNGKTF